MKARGSNKKVAGMSDATVHAKTGKTWAEWLVALDKLGAKKMSHRDIARLVYARFPKIGGWWAQMVTVGYEQARGLREAHQKSDGYSATVSRTVAAPVGKLYKAWTDAGLRRGWLGSAKFTITTATRNKVLRIKWPEGNTRVGVYFIPKGPRRCQMSVQHDRLAARSHVAQKKAFWGNAFEKLTGLVEAS